MSTSTEETTYDINSNVGDDSTSDINLLEALNEDRDAGTAPPPIPDSWPLSNGRPIIYRGVFDFQNPDADKRFDRRVSKKMGAFSMTTIRLKVIGCDNPEVPEELYEDRGIQYVTINSMVMNDGRCGYVDLLKSISPAYLVEVKNLKAEIAKSGLRKTSEINDALMAGLEELLVKAVVAAEPVHFRGFWHAQYKGTEIDSKTNKEKYETLKKGMKNFPAIVDDETNEVVGYDHIMESPLDGSPVAARFDISVWVPQKD